ncbi:CDP-glucose 4,6-dehydratase [Merismopedia glauca]|uniref:CDP-glucose 4,6-dehydratase n=1 Tax=Merismopedia glauca CCAP 1448/3 TaxID=1296344 RepID=A0A2T1C5L1_9CYAN|nr:CDP-glucose 4,6-dehydratase [Merismopedia glauca]PSB03413.1 CDP-glucose 4,6-dehydratase [Merismopedia glauca CCAP 1448/3]
MNPQFWQGKTVLITGHTGFKGSWLCLWLQGLGAKVTGYSLLPPTKPSLFEVARVEESITSVIGDIRDRSQLQAIVAQSQPEIIFHLAAQALVRESYQNPVDTYATNVMGTVNLLEAVRGIGSVKVVVNVTSDKCYENREWIWGYRENEPLGGYDPYSSSKACAEIVTAAYRNSFFHPDKYAEHGLALATARAGNVIGGGDWASDRLVPDIINSAINGQTLLIRNPYATRPWQHVLEPLNGYLTLAEHLFQHGSAYSEAWNFGPNESDIQPVHWIVEQLLSLWGDDLSWTKDTLIQSHEANYLSLDCAKARSRLGWRPKLDLLTALTWIVDWTKLFQSGKNMRAVTEDQIRQFTNL